MHDKVKPQKQMRVFSSLLQIYHAVGQVFQSTYSSISSNPTKNTERDYVKCRNVDLLVFSIFQPNSLRQESGMVISNSHFVEPQKLLSPLFSLFRLVEYICPFEVKPESKTLSST